MQKLLIISDTHLSHKIDEKKLTFLKNLIENSDQVIINGDFWDSSLTTFDKFVNSKWNQLFPILKDRYAIYLYGNHDMQHLADERVKLFSIKQYDEYKIKIGDYILNIEHGHNFSAITKFVYKYFKDKPVLLRYLTLPTELLFYINERLVKEFNFVLFHILNMGGKKLAKSTLEEKHVLITGHTHAPYFDLGNKYINLGFIRQGFASYVIATEEGLQMVKCRY